MTSPSTTEDVGTLIARLREAADRRVVVCPGCGGDKGWDVMTGGWNPINGEPDYRWVECGCDDGFVEIEVEPLNEEDRDYIDWAIAESDADAEALEARRQAP